MRLCVIVLHCNIGHAITWCREELPLLIHHIVTSNWRLLKYCFRIGLLLAIWKFFMEKLMEIIKQLCNLLQCMYCTICRFVRCLIFDVMHPIILQLFRPVNYIHIKRTMRPLVTHFLDSCILLVMAIYLQLRKQPSPAEVNFLAMVLLLIMVLFMMPVHQELTKLRGKSKLPVQSSVALCKLLIIIWESSVLLSYHYNQGLISSQ